MCGFRPPQKTPNSGCPVDFWSKNVFLIMACNDTIKNLKVCKFIIQGCQTPGLGTFDFFEGGGGGTISRRYQFFSLGLVLGFCFIVKNLH